VQQADLGKRARKSAPKKRRRSKMKGTGKLGMLVGAAIGYVLGAKAGRERYEQMTASARQVLDHPQVKRVIDSAPGNLGARVEQVANKAADKVQEAGDKVAAGGSGTTGATSGTTTTTATPSTSTTRTTPAAPSTSGSSASTATTPGVPSTSTGAATTTSGSEAGAATTTDTGTTTKRSGSGERKSKSS
jgi:hypothetical protein